MGTPIVYNYFHHFFGDNANDFLGKSLALSGDGLKLFVGGSKRLLLFEDNGNSEKFTELSEYVSDEVNSVACTNDGMTVIIGQSYYDSNRGQAIVLHNVNGEWFQKGNSINGYEQGH